MIEYILLGVIQAVTEWLPVSSQGQVVLFSVSGLGIPAAEAMKTAIWLHVGTMLAAIVYFRKDLWKILKSIPSYSRKSDKEDHKLFSFLFISTLLTGIVGFPLYYYASEAFAVSSGEIVIAFIGLLLIVTGLLQKRAVGGTRQKVNTKESVIVGIAQGFSALPGISRSGITTSTLLLRGFNSEAALRLSFLMSIFAVAAAEIGLSLTQGFTITTDSIMAAATAFIVGIISIDVFLRIARKIKFWKFCIILGLISLVPLAVFLSE